jgi:hypothetical protein
MTKVEVIKDENTWYVVAPSGVYTFEGNYTTEIPYKLVQFMNTVFLQGSGAL